MFGKEEEKFDEAVEEAEVCLKTFSFFGTDGNVGMENHPLFKFPFNFPVFFRGLVS